jgi:hypothetical protein
VSLFKKKIPMPEPSRFDRFDDETLYLLVEQAFGQASASLREATKASDESVVNYLHVADVAMADAQAGLRALLRRRLALVQNL